MRMVFIRQKYRRKGKVNKKNYGTEFYDKIVSPRPCPICVERASFEKVYLYYSVTVHYLGQTALKTRSCLLAQKYAEENSMSKVVISESYSCPCCSFTSSGRVKTYKATAMELVKGL